MDMTEGFIAFPLKFPGTKVWAAYKGRNYILQVRQLQFKFDSMSSNTYNEIRYILI